MGLTWGTVPPNFFAIYLQQDRLVRKWYQSKGAGGSSASVYPPAYERSQSKILFLLTLLQAIIKEIANSAHNSDCSFSETRSNGEVNLQSLSIEPTFIVI